MPMKRLELPCPHCGAASKAAMTLKAKDGTPKRYRKCDNGHRFLVQGGPEIMRMGPKKRPDRVLKLYAGPILSEWRPLPVWPVIV
jgi:hypothetical protein